MFSVDVLLNEKQINILNEWEGYSRFAWNETLWIAKMLYDSPIFKDKVLKREKDEKKPDFKKFQIRKKSLRDFIRKVQNDEISCSEDVNYLYEFVESCFSVFVGVGLVGVFS